MSLHERYNKIINFYTGTHIDKLDSLFGVNGKRLEVLEEKFILPPSYQHYNQKYKKFNARPTDIWVISYPKSGTTWTQEMVWCIQNGLNSEGCDEMLMKRFPFFEFDGLMPNGKSSFDDLEDSDPCKPGETWKILHIVKDPRTIKSHLPVQLLPDNIFSSSAKIVYVCRDPRDVCVSHYYHSIKLSGFVGNFQEFLDLFIKDLHFYAPYWKNVLGFWNRRDHPNLLFIRYEELHEDLPKMIRVVADFLGKTLTDEFVETLSVHLSFTSMKANKAVNGENLRGVTEYNSDIKFIRKGKVGDWKSHFTAENEEEFRKWTMDYLKGTDFPFYRDYDGQHLSLDRPKATPLTEQWLISNLQEKKHVLWL